MAKKVKFPLDMGNDIMVRTIEELKENYNAEKVTECFLNGKLLTWLEDRYYDEEAESVKKLSEQANIHNPAVKLGEIFGIKVEETVNVEELEIRREKLEKLRAITSDDEILDNVDSVAFSQEDLGDLLDDGKKKIIYLCGEKFRIPLSVKNVKYIGVNNPAVSIGGKSESDFEESGISFEKCELPEEIKEKIAPVKKVDSEFKIKVYVPKQTATAKESNTVLAAEYNNEIRYIYFKHGYRYRAPCDTSACFDIRTYGKEGVPRTDDGKQRISKTAVFIGEGPWEKQVFIKGNPNSILEIFKNQMLEAFEELPRTFKKKDGIVDITDSETIAAVEEAVRNFIEYRDLDKADNN